MIPMAVPAPVTVCIGTPVHTLYCRACTARCWGPVLALCMDRAWHFCVWLWVRLGGCALCVVLIGGSAEVSVQYSIVMRMGSQCVTADALR